MMRYSQSFFAMAMGLAVVSLAGCASAPVQPTYVPVTDYQDLSCDGLHAEYARIDQYIQKGVTENRSVFSGVGLGLGVFGGSGFGVGFSPSVTFGAGQSTSSPHAAYARLLGQREAVSQQAKLKGCPIVLPAAPQK